MDENKNSPQCKKIIVYLKTHNGITPIDAITELHIMRLASRISELKQQGYNIIKTTVKAKNSDGEDVRYAKYSLMKEDCTYGRT